MARPFTLNDDNIVLLMNLYLRFGLPPNVLTLFKHLGARNQGSDTDTIGQLIRTSPDMRKACTDTISQLATVMQTNKEPGTIVQCTQLIRNCTEMLALGNLVPNENRFPLMKLPAEIRKMVYKEYFHDLFTHDHEGIVIAARKHIVCACLPLEGRDVAHRLNVQLAFTSKMVAGEVLAAWFHTYEFKFGCGCELIHCLKNNTILQDNLKSVNLHWNGPKSDQCFKLLKQVDTLKCLHLVVSKSTSNNLTVREQKVRKYFHKITGKNGQVRLAEALGFDALLQLKDLEEVKVEHIDRTQGLRRSEERHSLEMCLRELTIA